MKTTSIQKYKIFLCGSYHGNNIGDAAILDAFANGLSDHDLTVLSKDGDKLNDVLGSQNIIKTVAPTDVIGIVKTVNSSDIAVIGGGGLFFDHNILDTLLMSKKSQLQYWIIITIISKLFGKKVVWSGVGVGPVKSLYGRFLLKLGMYFVDKVIVRDENSGKLLKEKKGEKVIKSSDIVFSSRMPDFVASQHESRSTRSESRKKIAMILMETTEIKNKFEKIINDLKKDFEITLLATNPRLDNELLKLLAKNTQVHFLDTSEFSIEEFREELRTFDLMISMRMHGLLIGFQEGILGIGLSPDIQKIEELQLQIYGEELFVNEEAFENLSEKIQYLLENQERLKEKGLRNYEVLEKLSRKNIDEII